MPLLFIPKQFLFRPECFLHFRGRLAINHLPLRLHLPITSAIPTSISPRTMRRPPPLYGQPPQFQLLSPLRTPLQCPITHNYLLILFGLPKSCSTPPYFLPPQYKIPYLLFCQKTFFRTTFLLKNIPGQLSRKSGPYESWVS